MQELLVCIVDDDEAVRISIRMLIETLGVPARAYAGAQAFLDDREVHTLCGCLVLDVRMPGMSGLELQEHLDGPLENLPVIFLSGHGDVPMVVRAMRAGAIDFLQKPFNEQALLDKVQEALAISTGRLAQRRERSAARASFRNRSPLRTPTSFATMWSRRISVRWRICRASN